MYVQSPIDYLFRVFVLRTVESLLDPHSRVTDAKVTIELFETVTESETGTALVAVKNEGKPPDLKVGLEKIHNLMADDYRVRTALEEIISQVYLAARQEGAQAAAGKLTDMARNLEI